MIPPNMATYRLQSAYLPQGWTRDARVTVSDHGLITAVHPGSSEQCNSGVEPIEHVAGVVVPGMPNAHSHAFQRAMAGNAEYRTGARDSFWTWRQAMYGLANRIGPEDLQAAAARRRAPHHRAAQRWGMRPAARGARRPPPGRCCRRSTRAGPSAGSRSSPN